MDNINSNLFNRFTNASNEQLSFILQNAPSTLEGLTSKENNILSNDVFTRGNDSLGSTTNSLMQFLQAPTGATYTIPMNSNLVYDEEKKQLFLQTKADDGSIKKEPLNLQNSVLQFPPFAMNQLPIVTDQNGKKIEIGTNDKLLFDKNTGQFYLKKADGSTENITNKEGNLTIPNLSLYTEPQIARAAQEISGQGKIWEALGLPEGLYTGVIDVNSMVPNLGDQTGITVQAGIFASAGLYTQLQRTISIINWLNTAPTGTQPNPNFSYIPGRPPYQLDTPEGKREQAKVFAQLRTTIIAQLTRITDQLKAANTGLKQQTDFASSELKTQTSEVKKWVDAAGEAK